MEMIILNFTWSHFYVLKTALPISSSMFRGGKQTEPQCPSRLDVEVLTPSTWSRAPNSSVKVHRMKMSDVKGWSMLTEETGDKLLCYAFVKASIFTWADDKSQQCLMFMDWGMWYQDPGSNPGTSSHCWFGLGERAIHPHRLKIPKVHYVLHTLYAF